MEDLVLSCLESRVEENRHLYARFLVGPFLKGDALTVATALRRVLLSSVESIGITALYIQGITHEFSTIPGVRESVLEISLNFGAIVLSYDKTFFQKKAFFDKLQIGYLQVQGPKVIYANHLKLPLGVKLVDPTQYIATVSKGGSLVLKFIIGKRTELFDQSTASESHFGNHDRDIFSIGELGKKNITKAKKTFFYKNGSTIACRPTKLSSYKAPLCGGWIRHNIKAYANLRTSRCFSDKAKIKRKGTTLCTMSHTNLRFVKVAPSPNTYGDGVGTGVTLAKSKSINFQAMCQRRCCRQKSFAKIISQNPFCTQSLALRASGNTLSKNVSAPNTEGDVLSAKWNFALIQRKRRREWYDYNTSFFKEAGNCKNNLFRAAYDYKKAKFRKNKIFEIDPQHQFYLKNKTNNFGLNRCRINDFSNGVQSKIKSFKKNKDVALSLNLPQLEKAPLQNQQFTQKNKTISFDLFPPIRRKRQMVRLASFFSVRSSFYQTIQKFAYKDKTSYKRNYSLVIKKGDIGKNKICIKGNRFFKASHTNRRFVKVLAFIKSKRERVNSANFKKLKFLNSNNIFKSNICLRNVIPLDSILAPILKVSFVVEVDDEVLYLRQRLRERIILEVWTNGSIHPRQAVHDAALSLTDMFASFRSLYEIETHSLSSLKTQRSNKNIRRNFQYLKYTAKLRNRAVKTIARSRKN